MPATIALLLACLLIGAILQRWAVLLVPIVAFPTYSVGINQGWWGCCGTGDSWQWAAAMLLVLGILATVAGILIGKTISLARRPSVNR